MKFHYLLVLLTFVLISNNSYSNFEFGGYVYNFPSLQLINKETNLFGDDYNNVFTDLTRLRLKPSYHFSEDTRIELNYEIDALISEKYLPLLSNVQVTNRQALKLNWQVYDSKYIKVNHFIDLLYFKHIFEIGEISIGRQYISWGVGRVWQPTDMFNPINPANFSKVEKDGADAIAGKLYLGSFSDLDVLANFANNFKSVHFGARIRTNILENDLALVGGKFDENFIIGGSIAGNLFKAGIRAEGIYSFAQQVDDSYFRGILGIDYQFTDKLYSALEYQFNGAGTSDKMQYLKYFDKLFRGEIQNLSQNYLAAIATYQFQPLLTTNFTSIINFNDLSAMLLLSTRYELLQSLYLSAGILYTLGDRFTEYWYYNDAIYLTFEYYF